MSTCTVVHYTLRYRIQASDPPPPAVAASRRSGSCSAKHLSLNVKLSPNFQDSSLSSASVLTLGDARDPRRGAATDGARWKEGNKQRRWEQQGAISRALQRYPWETRPINHAANPLFLREDNHAAGANISLMDRLTQLYLKGQIGPELASSSSFHHDVEVISTILS